MSSLVYALCALTSVVCCALLVRAYLRTPSRLLLWTSLCFAFLALNNALLVADLAVWTASDLSLARGLTGFVGLVILLGGLIWDAR